MLQKMRTSTGSWIAKGILGLLVLSFLGWGVADYTTTGGSGNTVAEVGDREISFTEFYTSYQRFLQGQQLGGIEPEVARQLRLGETVLRGMTTRMLYEVEASRLDLTASDRMVLAEIEKRPAFQGAGGTFNRLQFENVLRQNGLSEAAMVELIRKDIGRGQLIGAVTAGSAAPTALIDRLFTHFGERRSAEFIQIPISGVTVPEVPDDAALQAFYEERKEDFRRPELRGITYVLISPEAVAETMEIPEADLLAAYEDRKDELSQPEQRSISQILFNTEDAAQAAAQALRDVPLDELDARITELDLQMIPLGDFTRQQVPNESLANAAFDLPGTGVSGAFEGAFGWSLVVVTDIQAGSEPTLQDVREMLSRDLALDRAYDEVFSRGSQLEDAFAQGMSLAEAGEAIGIEANIIQAVDATGRGPDGTPLEDLPEGLTFLRTAFESVTQEGDISFLETTESNAMFMLRVDDITPSAIPNFGSVRDEVVAAWIDDARYQAAEQQAEALVARLGDGEDMAQIATELGVETDRIEGFNRAGQGPSGTRITDVLAQELFRIEPGNGAFAIDGDAFVIARLTGITPAEQASDPAFKDNLADAVTGGMVNDLIEQLGAALEKSIEIEIHPAVIDQVYQ